MNKKDHAGSVGKFVTGIPGFDQLTGGGLAANRTTLVVGGPGAGKTVFALQVLVNGARRREPGIFVSFGEQPRQLIENAATFGWDLEELEKAQLALVDARVRPDGASESKADFCGMLAGLEAVARELGARRIIFDSVEVLLALIDDARPAFLNALRLRDWLFENEFTCVLTANLQGNDPAAMSRYAALQFIADCTVALEYRVHEGLASRSLRVVKYRGSSFPEREFPLLINESGIQVLLPPGSESAQASSAGVALKREIRQARKELTSRIQALDRFLEMKQAELDFLLEKESAAAHPPEVEATPSLRQNRPDLTH